MRLEDAEREACRLLALRQERIRRRSVWSRIKWAVCDLPRYEEQIEPSTDEVVLMAVYERNLRRWNDGPETNHLPFGLLSDVRLVGYMYAGSPEETYRLHVSTMLKKLCESGRRRANPNPSTESERRLAAMGVPVPPQGPPEVVIRSPGGGPAPNGKP